MSAYRYERAGNAAAVVSPSSGGLPGPSNFIPALVLLLALAGAGATRRRGHGGELAYEPRSTRRRSNR
jgi:MYXO-CTERM domain-containing protein